MQANKHGHAGPSQTHYLMVFGALALLTLVTVTMSQFKSGMASVAQLCGMQPHTLGTLFALFIAVIKASLVVSIFMNMKFEKRFMWGIVLFPLLLTLIFILAITPDIAFHKVPPPPIALP